MQLQVHISQLRIHISQLQLRISQLRLCISQLRIDFINAFAESPYSTVSRWLAHQRRISVQSTNHIPTLEFYRVKTRSHESASNVTTKITASNDLQIPKVAIWKVIEGCFHSDSATIVNGNSQSYCRICNCK